MQKLDEQTIRHRLNEIANWQYKDGSLIREWQFADFKEAMRFINKVAELAEEHGHHPEIFNVYNRVRLSLSTHDAGGITGKDFDLARAIDQINS